jgi:Aldehyde dehydrogenase family
MKELRAASRSSEPISLGSRPATSTAPARVCCAASCPLGEMPAGIVLANSVRYTAVPTLPKTAMPSAPPSSPVVSEIADAAPVRSSGADPTTMSVANVNTGARPKEEMTSPAARIRNDVDASIWMNSPNPIAATAKPLVCGGPVLDGPLAKGSFYRACLLEVTNNAMDIVQEETFGPVITLQLFDSEAEAVRLANDNQYGLAASIWSRDVDRPLRVARELDAGTI